MNTTDPEYADVRAFMDAVAENFRGLDPSSNPEAVFELADAGNSFEHDLVQTRFRMRGKDDVNASGIIITVHKNAPVPEDVTAAEVADIVAERLRAVDVEVIGEEVSRVRYAYKTLDELLCEDA